MPDIATGNPTSLTPPLRNANLDATLQSISAPASLNPGSLLQQKQNERQFLIGKTVEQIDRNKELTAEEKNLRPPTLTNEQIQHYTSPPKEQHTDPISAFGSAAMMVAVFGSMFTRQPLLNSLNAAGKVLDAYKRGDDQAAQQNFVEWKSATDAALKLHQIQYDAYHDALSRISQEKKEGWAELQGLAASFKDDTLKSLLEAGQLDLARQHIEVMKAQIGVLNEKKPEIEDKAFFYGQKKTAFTELQQGQAELAAAGGDPNKIAAARDKIASATQRLQDIQLAEGKGKAGTSKPAGGLQGELLEEWTQEQISKGHTPTAQERIEQAAKIRGESMPSVSAQRAEEKRADAADTVDSTLRMVDQVLGGPGKPSLIGAWSTGAGGEAAKIGQGAAGVVGIDLGTQQAQFAQHAEMVQAAIRNELIKSHYMSKGAIEQLDEIVPGLGLLDDPVSTRQRWEHLKSILGEERDRLRGAPGSGKGRASPSGTKDDPLMPSTPTEVDSIPAGKIYIDPRDPVNLRVK